MKAHWFLLLFAKKLIIITQMKFERILLATS